MSIGLFLIYLAVTTIYGWILYRRGFTKGAQDLADMQVEAGIIKDKLAMYRKLAEHFLGNDKSQG